MAKLKPTLPFIFSVLGAVSYGLFIRLAFGSEQLSDLFGLISGGFLFFTPLGLGISTVLFAPPGYRSSWLFGLFGPWVSCLIFAALAAIFTLEAWICIVMALPIFLAMATAGGLAALIFFKLIEKPSRPQSGALGLLLLLPFLITPLEKQLPAPESRRVVHTQIEIAADAETVWGEITRVAPIQPAEHRPTFFHRAGLPRPVQATLSADGVGGVRRGQWEAGLAFIETITAWEPPHSYTMAMQADTARLAPSLLPLEQIGGRHFDVVQGQYRIEPLGEGRVMLHFSSVHRLNTYFNGYAGLWTDLFMRDVQNYILRIVKTRAESAL